MKKLINPALFLTLCGLCVSCDLYLYGKTVEEMAGSAVFPSVLLSVWELKDANTGNIAERYVIGLAKDLPQANFDHYRLNGDEYTVQPGDIFIFYDELLVGIPPAQSAWLETGIVRRVSSFSGSAGVIIFELFDDRLPCEGNREAVPYRAMYFRIISENAVQLAVAKDLRDNGQDPYIKTATIDEAVSLFRMGNEGEYVNWSYTPVYKRDGS
jgi:hypothetical protein